jgi:hypothetical protein
VIFGQSKVVNMLTILPDSFNNSFQLTKRLEQCVKHEHFMLIKIKAKLFVYIAQA